jgi:hypothetical protein
VVIKGYRKNPRKKLDTSQIQYLAKFTERNSNCIPYVSPSKNKARRAALDIFKNRGGENYWTFLILLGCIATGLKFNIKDISKYKSSPDLRHRNKTHTISSPRWGNEWYI